MMSHTSLTTDDLKERAARAALAYVQPGMVLGLGTGSTADLFTRGLAEAVRSGRLRGVVAVPTSRRTASLAAGLGITVRPLEQVGEVDLCVDGADEVDPRLDLLKGMGGAFYREKLVAAAARQYVIVADESKLVTRLGERAPLPVGVERRLWQDVAADLRGLGADPVLRTDAGHPVETDEGHFILDCRFPGSMALAEAAPAIEALSGVVDHGLFLGMADVVLVGRAAGVDVLVAAAG